METERRWTRSGLAFFLALTCAPAWAGGLAIVNTVLTDDGDHDSFADTRETVSLRLTLKNTSGAPLNNVTLRLVPYNGALCCLSVGEIAVGSFAVGETRLTDPFVFTVADVDRAGLSLSPTDDLSVTFDVLATAASQNPAVLPAKLTFDLDLDVSGGGAPTEFLETFEANGGSMGAFENENLDQGKASLPASDGYRCQYNDPDRPGSITYGSPQAEDCYLGFTPLHADAVFWGLSGPTFSPTGGRGFQGVHSLFFGIDLGPPRDWTTPLGTLDAVRTSQPIHLGWGGAAPVLSMFHQTSLADTRCLQGFPPGITTDRAVVMVQLAGPSGAPVGPWIKLEPYQNTYDQQGGAFISCSFDPIDDGSTEDDFFYPTAEYGPSSTCYPEKTFVNIGETSNPFSAPSVGRADGPGLEGSWGIGTWVESRFDLGRFRGQSIRLRFLVSNIQQVPNKTWEELYGPPFGTFNPTACDDGWWIDDVRVTGALTSAAVLATDVKDNSSLPGPPAGDGDGDGQANVCDNCLAQGNGDQLDQDHDEVGDACDVCPTDPTDFDPDGDLFCAAGDNCPFDANPAQIDGDTDGSGLPCDCNDAADTVHPGAEEINDGQDNQCDGSTDEVAGLSFFQGKTTYRWVKQTGATQYQVVRSRFVDFSAGCFVFPLSGSIQVTDSTNPLPGTVHYYLVRAKQPNQGSWGQNSAGAERVVPCVP